MVNADCKALISSLREVKTDKEMYEFVRGHRRQLNEEFFDALHQTAFFPEGTPHSFRQFLQKLLHTPEKPVSIKPDSFMVSKLSACHTILAEIASGEQDYALAVTHYRRAVEIADILDNSMPKAMLLRDLGFALHKAGRLEEALVEWYKAAELFWQLKDEKLESEFSEMVHSACWVTGAFDHSISFAEKCLQIYNNKKKRNWAGICRELNALGLAFSFMGLVRESVDRFEEACEVSTKLNDGRVEERNTLGNLARTYAVSGQFEKARALYEKILSISTDESEENLRARLLAHSNLGLVLRELGQPLEALAAFSEALALTEQIKDDDNRKNRLMSSIGLAHRDRGEMPDALHFYERALILAEKAHDMVGEGDAAGHLGNYHYEMNQLEKAERCYRRALELAEKTGDKIFVCRWTGNLANTLRSLAAGSTIPRERAQKYSEAAALYTKALELARSIGDINHEYLWNYNLGSFSRQVRGDTAKAYEYFRESIRCLELLRGQVKQDDFSRAFGESRFFVYHDMVNTCLALRGRRSEAIDFIERGKGYTLMRMMEGSQHEVAGPLSRRYWEVRHKIQALRNRLAISATGEPASFPPSGKLPQVLNAYLNKAITEEEKALEEISKLNPEFVATVRPETVTINDIQDTLRRLKKETALVEFFVTAGQTNVVVVWNDGWEVIEIPQFTEKDLLQIYYPQWRQAYVQLQQAPDTQSLEQCISSIVKMCHELGNKCWQRVQKQLDDLNAKRLILVPHGALHLFPLHLISTGGKSLYSPQYLIDQYEVVYSPSFRMLGFCLSENRRSRNHQSFFAVTNPDESLAFADFEVGQIARLFEQIRILEHAHASTEAVLNEPDEYHFLHFATHGWSATSLPDPMDAGLLMANDSQLSARDIFAKMKIRQSYAVILSACETGLVQLDRGDEYVGLPAAFLYAGSPTVVSSLWSVDDVSTALLMINWYKNIRKGGMGRGEALWRAQHWLRQARVSEVRPQILSYLRAELLELEKRLVASSSDKEKKNLEKRLANCRYQLHRFERADAAAAAFPHPYYWGAFVISGNPE